MLVIILSLIHDVKRDKGGSASVLVMLFQLADGMEDDTGVYSSCESNPISFPCLNQDTHYPEYTRFPKQYSPFFKQNSVLRFCLLLGIIQG